jgi:ribosomal protein S18 acetylase RimI-like enzyme
MISLAEEKDIPDLLKLINAAYRGDQSRKGWTHEADLVDGNLRTDGEVLSDLLNRVDSAILKHVSGNEITGCVHLEKQGANLYLGMLSVSPVLQGNNIGKKLLIEAEKHAAKNKLDYIVMSVINVRHELISWYERHGYNKTGETKPFPADSKFGSPKQPLEFVVLQKKVLSYNNFN